MVTKGMIEVSAEDAPLVEKVKQIRVLKRELEELQGQIDIHRAEIAGIEQTVNQKKSQLDEIIKGI